MKLRILLLCLLVSGMGCRQNNRDNPNHSAEIQSELPIGIDSLYTLAMMAYEGEDYAKAIQYFDALLLQDSLVSDAWHDRGLCYYMLENYPQAEQDVRTSMRQDSTYAPGWLQLGMIYSKNGKIELALAALSHSLNIDSTLAPAWFEEGAIYMDLNKVNEACFRFQKAANLGFEPAKKALAQFCHE